MGFPSTENIHSFAENELFKPILTKALASLCEAKPEDPVKWLAEYLLTNNPNKPASSGVENVTSTLSAVVSQARWLPSPGEEDKHIGSRNGTMIGSGSILKADFVSSNVSQNIKQPIPGAANFRQSNGFPVFMSAQPTEEAYGAVIDAANAALGSSSNVASVICLRESFVVYIQGKPYSVRSIENPFEVIWSTDESQADVEEREECLKAEVIAEIARCGGKLMLHEESDSADDTAQGQLFGYWASVRPDEVQTPKEIAARALAGRKAVYSRVPIANDHSPENRDIDLLLSATAQAANGGAVIFIDRMGYGRATTASAIACLSLRSLNKVGPAVPPPPPASVLPKGREALEKGLFASVLEFRSHFEGGDASLASVEDVCGRVGALVDIQKAPLAALQNLADAKQDAVKGAKAQRQALWLVDRWTCLLLVAQFLNSREEGATFESFADANKDIIDRMDAAGLNV